MSPHPGPHRGRSLPRDRDRWQNFAVEHGHRTAPRARARAHRPRAPPSPDPGAVPEISRREVTAAAVSVLLQVNGESLLLAALGLSEGQGVPGPRPRQPVVHVLGELFLLALRENPVDHDHEEADQEEGDADADQSRPIRVERLAAPGPRYETGKEEQEGDEDEDHAEVEGGHGGR